MNSKVQEGVRPEKSSGLSFAKGLTVRRERRVRRKENEKAKKVVVEVAAAVAFRLQRRSEGKRGREDGEAAAVRSSRISW